MPNQGIVNIIREGKKLWKMPPRPVWDWIMKDTVVFFKVMAFYRFIYKPALKLDYKDAFELD